MNEPSYDQVAAFAALTKKDVDLRRLLGVGRLMAVEKSVRILMALFVGPLNAAQLARIAGSTIDAVRPRVREMVRLGVVEDDRRDKFPEYRILPRGRRLLKDLIDAASRGEADPLLDVVRPDVVGRARDRLRRELEGRKPNPYALPCNR